MFGNRFYGETTDELLGTKGTISRYGDEQVSFEPQTKDESAGASVKGGGAGVGDEQLTLLHMNNFFDCVRSRKQPNCPFELGFSSAIACRMAISSYRLGRTVRWDNDREQIL
jgi:hypothetical protein